MYILPQTIINSQFFILASYSFEPFVNKDHCVGELSKYLDSVGELSCVPCRYSILSVNCLTIHVIYKMEDDVQLCKQDR